MKKYKKGDILILKNSTGQCYIEEVIGNSYFKICDLWHNIIDMDTFFYTESEIRKLKLKKLNETTM